MKLLSTGNPKLVKGQKLGYLSFVLHLAPSTLSGHQTCPRATAGCIDACLNTAGRGGIFKTGETTNAIQAARIRKTQLFFNNRAEFMAQLVTDIEAGIRQAAKLGMVPVFRLNGTSDIAWEKIRTATHRSVMAQFPDVQFYDYTKVAGRTVPVNYHLTFSAAESNQVDVARELARGTNVAMVFDVSRGKPMIKAHSGARVIDGDDTDLRFLDATGCIVGLRAKGKALQDQSGFVRRVIKIRAAA
jgi:hypothetical protein